jgi:hypothetical protein
MEGSGKYTQMQQLIGWKYVYESTRKTTAARQFMLGKPQQTGRTKAILVGPLPPYGNPG